MKDHLRMRRQTCASISEHLQACAVSIFKDAYWPLHFSSAPLSSVTTFQLEFLIDHSARVEKPNISANDLAL